jgi:hypothetical protein
MNNCGVGSGSGRALDKVDEDAGGIGKINIKALNRRLDAWLAKHESGEVTAWKKKVYGKKKG